MVFHKLVGFVATAAIATTTPTAIPIQIVEQSVEESKVELTHQQDVWLSALEWCESRGDNSAVNPEDSDGTPSYYAFQFKPSTFDYFSKKYGVNGKISDYKAQRQIVAKMLLDEDVDLRRQFPACVKQLGLPKI